MKFAQEIVISWIISFPASIVPIGFQIIRCISIQNGIPYLTDAEKKGKCNWSKNDLIMRVFLFFLNQLFIYSTICVFIYLFIKQQLLMSTLAPITISIFCYQYNLTDRKNTFLPTNIQLLKKKLIIEEELQLRLAECLHNNEERDFFSTVDRNPDRS